MILRPLAYPTTMNPDWAAFPLGDLNATKSITVTDAVLSLDLAVGKLSNPSDQQQYVGDLNADKLFDVGDAVAILNKIVKPSLPALAVVDAVSKTGITLDTEGSNRTRTVLVGNRGNAALSLTPSASDVSVVRAGSSSDPGWALIVTASTASPASASVTLGDGFGTLPVTVNDNTNPNNVSLVRTGSTPVTANATLSFAAAAQDNRGVTRLDVLQDGVSRANATIPGNPPNTSVSQNLIVAFTPNQNGSHTMSARATDANGNTATSPGVVVSVDIPGLVLTHDDCASGNCTLTISTTGGGAANLRGASFTLVTSVSLADDFAALAGVAAGSGPACSVVSSGTDQRVALACSGTMPAPGVIVTVSLSGVTTGATVGITNPRFSGGDPATDLPAFPGDAITLR